MLLLLVGTYWLFMGISFVGLSKLLWALNPNLTLLTLGFFLLAKITKSIAEINLTKIVAEKQAVLLKEWEQKQKDSK